MAEPFVGKHIGDFVIQERIGQGPMSVLYRARQLSVNRDVAFKITTFEGSPRLRENFFRYFAQEATVVAKLEHIHIVPLYDYAIVNGEFAYVAMRLVRGGSLQDLLAGEPLSLAKTTEIFMQIAQGLAYAHRQGVAHRALKPSNIMLDELGHAYISDFGLGHLAELSLDLTEAGNVIGNPLYASPEQLTGRDIDRRTDIYSLSAILYHMLAGRPPFELGNSYTDFIRRHEQETPPPPRAFNPDVSAELEAIITRGLQPDPRQRYQTVEAMIADFSAAMRLPDGTSSTPSLLVARQRRVLRRRRLTPFILTGVFLLVALAAALVVRRLELSTPPPQATVIASARGSPADAMPSPEEVEAARRRLGESGFIAYVACSMASEFQARRAWMIEETAAEYALPVRVYDSNLDRYDQITAIERARVDGAGAIILCPLDSDVLTNTLTALQQARMPMVLVAPLQSSYGGVTIDADNYGIGVRAGRFAGQIIRDEMGGEAAVVILHSPDLQITAERVRGMMEGLEAIAPDATIVGRYTGGTTEDGRNSIRQLIEENVHFDLILSINDAGAYGAIEALEAAGFAPDSVAIVSMNGERQAQDAIREGRFLRATVSVDVEMGGRLALNAAVRLLAGATLPELLSLPPGAVITRETLAAAED